MGSRTNEGRTYGIWGLIGVFVLIAMAGLGMFLIVGSPRGETSQLATRQTLAVPPTTAVAPTTAAPPPDALPTDGPPTDAPTTAAPTTTVAAVAVTLPDGTPAPAGVSEVLRSDGAITYSFDPPAELGRTDVRTAIAPTTAVQTPDGSGLVLRVSCGLSGEEFLAQTSLTESPTSITIMAVVIAPVDAPPCKPGAPARELIMPLSAPATGRALVVVPAGTEVPGVDGG